MRDSHARAPALPFAKYEGLGNDFVVLEEQHCSRAALTPALAQAICDRHTGVGADGVLWLGREGDATRLIILNADGSRPEMCGNGVRCVAAFLCDAGRLAVGQELPLVTDAGPRPAVVKGPVGEGGAGALEVEVDMGAVRAGAGADTGVMEVSAGGRAVRVVPADAGNPHAVVFESPGAGLEMDVVRAVVGRADVFPQGANVEFVAREGEGFRVRVFERGVGWTQACGTGACAVAAAALAGGVAPAREGEPVAVTLDGGTLHVTLRREREGVFRARMRGPARRVFAGEYYGGSP